MEDGQTTEETPAVCNCTEKCAAGAVNTACPVCAVDMAGCMGQEPEPTPTPDDSKSDATACTEQLGRIEAKLDKLLGLVNPSLLEG